ncbi:MAG TPA: hypothetical protein VK174_02720 [Chitinophagales bacterium]|nr:hypothetical protein [Chitinophagales bacterium]
MLAVHWTPVSNTGNVLKNGIRKSKTGLYCFPLTGNKRLDAWWVKYFNQYVSDRKKYVGIVFRITEEDMPACFSHWIGNTTKDSFTKEIKSIKELTNAFRETLVWRMAETTLHRKHPDRLITHEDIDKLSARLMKADSTISLNRELQSYDLRSFAFDDHQIVLSHSIPAKRIIKVLPQGNEHGRILKRYKQHRVKHRNYLHM